jgi:ABC-type molybdate transport system substrate-binding protein
METKTQVQQCEQIQKIAEEVLTKLRQGVKLPNGNTVAVNISVNHVTYVEMRECDVRVIYVTGCVGVHVDAAICGGCVEIKDVNVNNLCSDKYGV